MEEKIGLLIGWFQFIVSSLYGSFYKGFLRRKRGGEILVRKIETFVYPRVYNIKSSLYAHLCKV